MRRRAASSSAASIKIQDARCSSADSAPTGHGLGPSSQGRWTESPPPPPPAPPSSFPPPDRQLEEPLLISFTRGGCEEDAVLALGLPWFQIEEAMWWWSRSRGRPVLAVRFDGRRAARPTPSSRSTRKVGVELYCYILPIRISLLPISFNWINRMHQPSTSQPSSCL
ncbi:unnamed protein product [Urochloa humidicola]